MSQIIRPIDLKPQMIERVNHLVSHGIFQMALVFHLVGANQDSIFRVETAALAVCTTAAVDIMVVEVASQLLDVIAQVTDDGAYGLWLPLLVGEALEEEKEVWTHTILK